MTPHLCCASAQHPPDTQFIASSSGPPATFERARGGHRRQPEPSNSSAVMPGHRTKSAGDAGELAGIAPLGCRHQRRRRAARAANPTSLFYNPMWIDVDELVRILRPASIAVATAVPSPATNQGAGWFDRRRMSAGGSSMFGSGISPWLRQPAVHRGGRHLRPGRQDNRQRGGRHHVLRPAGNRRSRSVFGRPIDDPEFGWR